MIWTVHAQDTPTLATEDAYDHASAVVTIKYQYHPTTDFRDQHPIAYKSALCVALLVLLIGTLRERVDASRLTLQSKRSRNQERSMGRAAIMKQKSAVNVEVYHKDTSVAGSKKRQVDSQIAAVKDFIRDKERAMIKNDPEACYEDHATLFLVRLLAASADYPQNVESRPRYSSTNLLSRSCADAVENLDSIVKSHSTANESPTTDQYGVDKEYMVKFAAAKAKFDLHLNCKDGYCAHKAELGDSHAGLQDHSKNVGRRNSRGLESPVLLSGLELEHSQACDGQTGRDLNHIETLSANSEISNDLVRDSWQNYERLMMERIVPDGSAPLTCKDVVDLNERVHQMGLSQEAKERTVPGYQSHDCHDSIEKGSEASCRCHQTGSCCFEDHPQNVEAKETPASVQSPGLGIFISDDTEYIPCADSSTRSLAPLKSSDMMAELVSNDGKSSFGLSDMGDGILSRDKSHKTPAQVSLPTSKTPDGQPDNTCTADPDIGSNGQSVSTRVYSRNSIA